jgi:hypothetical protein
MASKKKRPKSVLSKTAVLWAFRHHSGMGDTDIFPFPPEYRSIIARRKSLVTELAETNLSSHSWSPGRRILYPKDQLGFRSACQLEPFDSILFAALIRTIGGKLERHRVSISEGIAYSYRFDPAQNGKLYKDGGWLDFWKASRALSRGSGFVLRTDITDFYNQIYHHTLENQLIEAGVSIPVQKVITQFLQSQSDKVSRGIPVGPHSTHLLAEVAIAPVDKYLRSRGIMAIRYADDFQIYCKDYAGCTSALYELASYLDSTQKLTLNRSKTTIVSNAEHRKCVKQELVDAPINKDEATVLKMLQRVVGPYDKVPEGAISEAQRRLLDRTDMGKVISAYLNGNPIDYQGIRWFLRRCSQAKITSGVEFVLSNLELLIPVVAEAVKYLLSVESKYQGDWCELGDFLLSAVDNEVVASNRYLRSSLFHLFFRISSLNHLDAVLQKYASADPASKREIVFAALAGGRSDWIRSLKNQIAGMDSWQRRAYLMAQAALPKDERSVWLRTRKKFADDLELYLIEDAISGK